MGGFPCEPEAFHNLREPLFGSEPRRERGDFQGEKASRSLLAGPLEPTNRALVLPQAAVDDPERDRRAILVFRVLFHLAQDRPGLGSSSGASIGEAESPLDRRRPL